MKKHKKFNRKLKLSKQTIVSLDQSDTKKVLGGGTNTCYVTLCDEISCLRICPCLRLITDLVTIDETCE